jgi:UPF0716 family protein affecting phage T7 exclusion
MGFLFTVPGLISMVGGALLLMPYTYDWMERIGSARRWAYGLGLLALGVGLIAAGQALD